MKVFEEFELQKNCMNPTLLQLGVDIRVCLIISLADYVAW